MNAVKNIVSIPNYNANNEEDFTQDELDRVGIECDHEDSVDDILNIFPASEINSSNCHISLTITPEQAKTLLSPDFMPTFQRAINTDNKNQYINDIKNGNFDKSNLIFGVLTAKGVNQFFNLDGRTRLSAVSEGGKPLDFHVIFNKYESFEELKTAYTKIDCGRKRTFVDQLNALEILKDKEIPKQLVSKLGGIFSIINGDFPGTFSGKRKGANDREAKISAVNSQVENVVIYGKMIAPLLSKKSKECPLKDLFLNPGVAAPIIHLMGNVADNKALHFFSEIILNTNLNEYQKCLVEAFLKLNEKNADVKKSKLTRIIEKVWNAKIEGSAINGVEIDDYKSEVTFKFA